MIKRSVPNLDYLLFYEAREYVDKSHVRAAQLVSLAEAHDSGACEWSDEQKSLFASDVDNIKLVNAKSYREDNRGRDWRQEKSSGMNAIWL